MLKMQRIVLIVGVFFCFNTLALAMQHSYINYMRSGAKNYIFVSQAVGGEYGEIISKAKGSDVAGLEGGDAFLNRSANWKGVGLKTTAGLEVFNFMQFEFGHTFVNLKHRDDGFESLSGSRFNVGTKLVFRSPLLNLEGGLGVLGSRMDYQNGFVNSDLYGSGRYYSLGTNYFLHSQLSVFSYYMVTNEHFVRNGGSHLVNEMDTSTDSMGLGFTLWL